MGKTNKYETEIIRETEYPITKKASKNRRQLYTLYTTLSMLILVWIVINYRQITGVYTIQNLYVQFDDDLRMELGAYTGFFELSILPWTIGISRLRYVAANGKGFFGFCIKEHSWTFSLEGDGPCDQPIIQSSETQSFNILEVAGEEWSVTADSASELYFPMESFFLNAGCERNFECGGHGSGKCVKNRCVCAEGRYGARCHYEHEATCDKIEIDTQRPIFRNSRDYSNEYYALRDDNGKIVQSYNHPVYFYETQGGGADIMLYVGFRWALANSKAAFPDLQDHSRKGLVEFFTSQTFHAVAQLQSMEFISESVPFNTPDDIAPPTVVSWIAVRDGSLENTEKQGPTETRLLCSICDDDENPCQNGNTCGFNGVCECSNGAEGALCQITPLSNGRCDEAFSECAIMLG